MEAVLAVLRGRPSEYTNSLADEICEKLADGKSLVEICKADNMPARSTVFRWLADEKYKTFQDMYTHAREVQAEYLYDELLDISDNGENDWMERNGKNGSGWQVNGEAIQRSKLRIDTRKWAASKLLPRKYGDKIHQELTGKDGGPVEISETSASQKLADILSAIAPPEPTGGND